MKESKLYGNIGILIPSVLAMQGQCPHITYNYPGPSNPNHFCGETAKP